MDDLQPQPDSSSQSTPIDEGDVGDSTAPDPPPPPAQDSTLLEGEAAVAQLRSELAALDMSWIKPRKYKFWNMDFHISVIGDVRHQFGRMCKEDGICMEVEEQSYSGHCGHTFGGRQNTCAKDIKGINRDQAFAACPHSVKRDFYNAYRSPDSGFAGVDAFLVHHPPGTCELFMAFNKSVVVLASVNLELGRENPARFNLLTRNLRLLAKDPRNVMAANNMYELEYLKYFTGLPHVHFLPSLCHYAAETDSYSPTKRVLAFARSHNNLSKYVRAAAEALGRVGSSVVDEVKDFGAAIGGGYDWKDVASVVAYVIIPYTKSYMFLFEAYALNVPLFVPERSLLASWEAGGDRPLNQRVYWTKVPHPQSPSQPHYPNELRNAGAIEHWLQFADFYQWPHVTQFSSWDDLVRKLNEADLQAISARMKVENERRWLANKLEWFRLFKRMFDGMEPGGRAVPSVSYEEAFRAAYGEDPGDEGVPCHRESALDYGRLT